MSKSVISRTSELTLLRRRYRRRNVIESLAVALAVIALAFAYIFLAVAPTGYGDRQALFAEPYPWWSNVFVYFETDRSLFAFDAFEGSLPLRWAVLLGALVLAALLAWVYGLLHGRRLDRKYQKFYGKALAEEVRLSGISIDSASATDESSAKAALIRTNIEKAVRRESQSFSSPSTSWTGIQYTYEYNGKNRSGYLMETQLSRSRTGGLIQFRTFGRPTLSEYEGGEIRKYGFAENPKMSEYVCYTSLGQDIYATIDATVVDALYEFKQYVGCGLVVTLAGQSLSVFIDGFKLNLVRRLKENLRPDFLEKQAAAVSALHKCVGTLAVAFSADQFVIQSDGQALA